MVGKGLTGAPQCPRTNCLSTDMWSLAGLKKAEPSTRRVKHQNASASSSKAASNGAKRSVIPRVEWIAQCHVPDPTLLSSILVVMLLHTIRSGKTLLRILHGSSLGLALQFQIYRTSLGRPGDEANSYVPWL